MNALRGHRAGNLGAIGLAVVVAALAMYAGHKYGPLAAAGAVVGVVAVIALLGSGRWAVLVAITVAIVAEDDPSWGISVFAKLYTHAPSPFEALEALALLGGLAHLARHRLPVRFPRPLGPVTVVLALALVAGVVTGLDAGTGARSAYISVLQGVSPLFLIPFLLANVIRTRTDVRAALTIGLGLAGMKALLGLFVVVSHLAPNQVHLGRLTYYHPAANLLLALTLLVMLAARLAGVTVPRRVWLLAPIVVVCLLLSYRRAIWLGTVLGAMLILFPASGRVGRRLIVPAAVAIGLFVYLAIGTGLTGDLQGGITSRVASINVGSIQRNAQDRYRIDERVNVWAAISRQPVTGIGLGTQWLTRYPISFEYPDGHLYAHFAALWWWMKMGVLGLAAYLLLILSVVFTGARVWLRHPDGVVRAFGLGGSAFAATVAIVELTSTVLGPDERGTLLFACVLGLLSIANSQVGEAPVASTKLAAP